MRQSLETSRTKVWGTRVQLITVIQVHDCSKDWLSTFCTTPIAAWKEQKGIAGANHSSSSGIVYTDGLREKSRLEEAVRQLRTA